MKWRIRDFTAPLSLYYTHGSAGCACAGAQAKENMMFSINKALHSDSPKPAEDLQRIFMQYIHAVIAKKWKSQLQNNIAPTGKIFFPNWEIIFSQSSTAYWRINIQKLSSHGFRILLRVHKTFLLKPNPQGKDLPRLLWPNPVIYYDRTQSSIKTELGRLLWPTPAIY